MFSLVIQVEQKKALPIEKVSNGMSTHAEAIQIYFDPRVLNFDKLLEIFTVAHDPTQIDRQGPDVGTQYRSGFIITTRGKASIDKLLTKYKKEGNLVNPLLQK